MTQDRAQRQAMKRLVSDLTFLSAFCRDDETTKLLDSVPRENALKAIEQTIAELNHFIDLYQRELDRHRAGIAMLERLRPVIFRGPLRVVKRGDTS